MIAAAAPDLWKVVSDPHHLPRWWPRVERVEDVRDSAFTEVMRTARGKVVRADFDLVRADAAARTLVWSQRVAGTPFARVLSSSETEVRLEPASSEGESDGAARAALAATEVTIELRQTLSGVLPRFGGRMVRRAAAATIDEALDGLERMHG